jgi:membrane protein
VSLYAGVFVHFVGYHTNVDVLRPIQAFDRYQQRHASLAIPMAVVRKFGNDHAGNLAALVAYYAFFSLFPLLLVLTTILGFVLQGDTSFQNAVEGSVLGQFPVIGDQIKVHELTGHVTALAIGLLVALWAGLGVTQAAQNAFDTVWAVPFKDRPDFIQSRLRGLLLLMCLGIMFMVAAAISGLVTALGGPLVKLGAIAVSLALNFGIYIAAFRFMTAASVPTRYLWIGAAVAAVFLEIMQLVGGIYINHVYRHASSVYSQFALVIALLVWLHLIALLTLYAAEINSVLVRKLWPRSLLGPPEAPADRETLRALAKVEERHQDEQVDVRFSNDQAQRGRGNGQDSPADTGQPPPGRLAGPGKSR